MPSSKFLLLSFFASNVVLLRQVFCVYISALSFYNKYADLITLFLSGVYDQVSYIVVVFKVIVKYLHYLICTKLNNITISGDSVFIVEINRRSFIKVVVQH